MSLRRGLVVLLACSTARADTIAVEAHAFGPADRDGLAHAAGALAQAPDIVACMSGATAAVVVRVEVAGGAIAWVHADADDARARCLTAALAGKPFAVPGLASRLLATLDVERQVAHPPIANEHPQPTLQLTLGTATVRGELDKAIIRRIFKAREGELAACVPQAFTGEIQLQFVIGEDGKVISATVDDARARDCVVAALSRWRFPAPKGGGLVIVNYPIAFAPAEPEVRPASVRALPMPAQLAGTISAIVEAPDGQLLVGTTGAGVHLYDGATAERADLAIDPAAKVRGFVDVGAGRLVVLAEGGATLVDASGAHVLVDAPARAAIAIGSDLWIGTTRGLYRVHGGVAESLAVVDRQAEVTALAPAEGGGMWLAVGDAIAHFDPARDLDALPRSAIGGTSLAIDRDGHAWAVGRGLARLPDGKCLLACELTIRRAAWDRDGGVWIVANDALRRIDLATREVSAEGPHVDDLLVTRNGGVVAIADGLLVQVVPARVREHREWPRELFQVARTRGELVTSSLPEVRWLDRDVFVDANRAWRADGTLLVERKDATITAIAGDLVGTDHGLVRTTGASVSPNPVAALARTGDVTWIGGPRGLAAWRDGTVVQVRDEPITQLATGTGVVAAASPRGLLVIHGDDITRLTSADGLAGEDVTAVAVLPDGTIAAATAGGLQLVRDGAVQTLARVDGFPAARVESLWADPDGTLWAATRGAGLLEIHPLDAPPRVAIDRLALDGRATQTTEVDVPWTANVLAIATRASSWVDRHDNLVVDIEARRDGERVWRWTGVPGTHEVALAELGTGDVELRVGARGVDGVPAEPAIVRLHIAAPPWRRTPLVLAIAGLFMAIVLGGWRGPRTYRRHVRPRLVRARARRELAADPARAIDLALALDPPTVAALVADRGLPAPTLAALRLVAVLDRDPEAGLRAARAKGDVDGWARTLDYLARVHAGPLPVAAPPLDGKPLTGLAEVLGVLGEADKETNLGKRWDYLRSAHDYLATLAELAPAELPRSVARGFVAVTAELRRKIAAQMREGDWREAQSRSGSDAIDSRKLRFVVENEFPRPIARAYSRLGQASEPGAQVPLAASLLETMLAYTAITLCAEARAVDGELRALMREKLMRGAPSAGDWLALARAAAGVLRAQQGAQVTRALAQFLDKDGLAVLDDAVARRNRMIHRNVGVTRADVDELVTILSNVLWSISAIRDAKLVVLGPPSTDAAIKRYAGRVLHGFHDTVDEVGVESNAMLPVAAPCLIAPRERRVVDLRPLCRWAACPDGDGEHLFTFARVANKVVEYVSPEGHIKRERDALAELQAWLGDDADTNVREVELLAADFDVAVDSKRRLPAGYVLKYEGGLSIDELIGRGGFADVYRAHRVDDGRTLAVKLLPYQYLRDPQLVRRFRQEGAAARKLDDPHIVHVLGFGEDVGDQFIVMELATGWDGVRDVHGLAKPAPLALALDVARQTLAGLAYVHGQGIVHRDIKPANLLLFDGGIVKIADFGTARTRESLHLTRTGVLAATPEYMSPEQAAGGEVDLRTDLYSLGIVLYELLAGALPFRGDTPIALALSRLRNPPLPLRKLRADAPAGVVALVDRLLAREVDDRPRTAAEALALCEAAIKSS